MSDGLTPRQRARAENLARIKSLALRQLAEGGAGELSLRAIARELNLVSSAIYRYYPSRDDLITDLIVDAYNDLADAIEQAVATRRGPRRRWIEACQRMRAWALAEPHRFALVYGSAIPGYRAPADTIAPAGRVIAAFLGPIEASSGADPTGWAAPDRRLATQLELARAAFDVPLSDASLLAAVAAFAQLIGALTLELNGHFVGGFEPADRLFAALVEHEASALGL